MDFEVIIIGAGMSGMYQLYALRKLGISARVLEIAPDVGGTWYYNRYPGCRFDSESYTYAFSFSKEMLDEWHWSELFAGQPEVQRYLNRVADKFDLRKDIDFNTRVTAATYDEKANIWTVETDAGRKLRSRYVITAVGPLSIPVLPDFPGRDTFKGISFHSYYWPEGLDLKGKRVAVVGTGATGIQIIQTIAEMVDYLTVYQRGGNWTKPLMNRPIGKTEMDDIKARYPQIFAKLKTTPAAFIHEPAPMNTFDVPDEERRRFYEQKYAEPGFAFMMSNFKDLGADEKATQVAADFLAEKIRGRVKDPKTAEILIPKDHPLGAKRMPMESDYFEAYNRDNVELINLYDTPLERITPDGIVTGGQERKFDIIVYATGFDAFRGSVDRIAFRGIGGKLLVDKWGERLATYLGFQSHGFPNLLMVMGPLSGATVCNFPRCIEQNGDFIAGLLDHMRRHGFNRVEPALEAENAWTQEAIDLAAPLTLMKYDTYANSARTQAKRSTKREILLHFAGQHEFRRRCDEIVADNYRGFAMSKVDEAAYA
jgi:cation diffusion facilitator CzcD-associated flavoprotein CzcO